jgi:hypothetical protein
MSGAWRSPVPYMQRTTPAQRRRYALRKYYKMTEAQFEELYQRQEGLCAICRRRVKLVVDHDHGCCPNSKTCGRCVRGLLCDRCNTGLYLLDEPLLKEAALEYLDGYVERETTTR